MDSDCMGSDLFTWSALATMGGASLLTFFIVLYTKGIVDKFLKVSTDLYAVLVAFIILSLAQIANGGNGLDWKLYGLSFANAFLIAAAAGQMHNKTVSVPVDTATPTAETKESGQ
jgi:hypothetical protein